jgi:hypothetical protein
MSLARSIVGQIRANVALEAPCRRGSESENGSKVELETEDRLESWETGKKPGAV